MYLLPFAFLLVGLSSALDWDPPYFIANEEEGIQAKENGFDIELTFEEETQVILLGNFTYEGNPNEEPPSVGGTDNSYVYIDDDNGKLALKLKKRVDYDNEKPVLKFRISKSDLVLEFVINLININDNPFEIQQPCRMDEDQEVGYVTECDYKITDKDGFDPSLKFDFRGQKSEGPHFKFNLEPQDLIGKTEATLKLVSLKKVNYNEESVIANTLIITYDGNPNFAKQQYRKELLVLVGINDLPNKPPEWITKIGSIIIKEGQSYSQVIGVQDGDYGLNWPVRCSLECTSNAEVCPKIVVTPDCELNIGEIKLEDPNMNILHFTIIGTDYNPEIVNDPNSLSSNQTVYLIIESINN